MPRVPRVCQGGFVYHVTNRGVRRETLFRSDQDYLCFQTLLGRAGERFPVRLIAYCLMPNHWHLVVWPVEDNVVSAYIQWLSSAHARYYNLSNGSTGHVYQSRFYSGRVRDEPQLMTLLRYVESNALRAGLVDRAEQWRWSSLIPTTTVLVTDSPLPRPAAWLDLLAATVGQTL
jgi:putative transposase